MKQQLCRFIYHRLLGWKTVITVPFYEKCVICAAPHTSNWDLLIGKLFYGSLGRRASFLMKRNGSSSRSTWCSRPWEASP